MVSLRSVLRPSQPNPTFSTGHQERSATVPLQRDNLLVEITVAVSTGHGRREGTKAAEQGTLFAVACHGSRQAIAHGEWSPWVRVMDRHPPNRRTTGSQGARYAAPL